MTKPALPDSQRRKPISVTLPDWALAALDRAIALGHTRTRSSGVELAIVMLQDMIKQPDPK